MSLPDYSAIYGFGGYTNNVSNINTTDYSKTPNTVGTLGSQSQTVAGVTNQQRTRIDLDTKTDYGTPITAAPDTGFTAADVHGVKEVTPLVVPSDKDIPQMKLPEIYNPDAGIAASYGNGSGGSGGSGSGTDGSGSGSGSGSKSNSSSGMSTITMVMIFILILIVCAGIGFFFYQQNKKQVVNNPLGMIPRSQPFMQPQQPQPQPQPQQQYNNPVVMPATAGPN